MLGKIRARSVAALLSRVASCVQPVQDDSMSHPTPEWIRLQPEIFLGQLRLADTDYVKLNLLGQGSYSIVYEVKRLSDNKRFTQKVIKNIVQNKDLDLSVYREVTILKNLDHDNVIKLVEILMGEEQRSLSLIIEYCDTDLEKYIKYYPLPVITQDIVKCMTIHLFRGLNYLHKNFIVHRDIKPSNLLIHSNGILKIADFGIARRWSHNNKPTNVNMNTVWYRAPEQAFEAPSYDSKVDIWSAGCVIIEIMTRKPFFEGCNTSIELINRMVKIFGKPTATTWPDYNKCRASRTLKLGGDNYNRLIDNLNMLDCTVAAPLLESLLKYNPDARLSADACLMLDFFQQAPFPALRIEKPDIQPYHRQSKAIS